MADHRLRPSLLAFLKDLAANNDRQWFQRNRERYERELREPALNFIMDFGAPLHRISPHFRADPKANGGSLFRIYRDVRFSRNKQPYKTHTGLYFRHEAGRGVHTPGFYLHLEPRACFVGVGLWHPDTATLKQIRNRVVADPEGWKKCVGGPEFQRRFKISGESLKRPPRGYDPDHELVDVLKLKDFTALAPLSHQQVTGADFLEEFTEYCRVGSSLVQYLCRALQQPF